jgi:tRNA 5-methylaminomethyl-2-thiouridine biosynthesis bifunctional protein
MSDHHPRVEGVRLEFRDPRTPYSPRFEDVYFSALDGIQESRYVYLEGSGFQESLEQGSARIEVAEIGFGVGLNFLLTLEAFLDGAKPNQHLRYHAFERYPVIHEDLVTLYDAYPELRRASKLLLASYPLLTPGVHALRFLEGRVRLWLSLGEAREQLTRSEFKASHWYWDGFAPSRNPDAFDPALFHQVARLSAPGARGASFTSAGWVRRGIEAAGFRIEKRSGFGHKRECIRAEYAPPGGSPPAPSPLPAWFARDHLRPIPPSAGPVAILGAGLAGTAVARSLAEEGYTIEVFDPAGPGAKASGNPLGLYHIQMSKKPNPISRFAQASLAAFLLEQRAIHLPSHPGILRTDLFDVEMLRNSDYPESCWKKTERGIRLEDCGVIHPPGLCRMRLDHPHIRLREERILEVRTVSDRFLLESASGPVDGDYAQVVYALGADLRTSGSPASPHPLLAAFPFRPIRGQIIMVPPSEDSLLLKDTLVEDGYASPSLPWLAGTEDHLIGATYGTGEPGPDQEEIDRDQLLLDACKWEEFKKSPERNRVRSRVGWRLSTPDKLPVVGPLVNPVDLNLAYGHAFRGSPVRNLPPLPVIPGQWILGGLGSRGITYSSLGATLLSDWITGERLSLELDLLEHLHSARFFIRQLKRSGVK